MSVPGLTKAASLPSKTWHCACKKVKIECIAGGNFLSECYCDDCYIRTKVMKDKYCGPCELAGRYHEFEKNGSRPMINQDTASMKVVSGEELIGYFRGACEEEGKKWKNDHATTTAYATCCGSLIGHNGPPPSYELNPYGFEEWERKEPDMILVTSGCKVTGVPLPKDKSGEACEAGGFSRCLQHSDWTCFEACKLCCCTTCACKMGAPCCLCCEICCIGSPQPAFSMAPPGAKEFNGKPIEYISETEGAEKYLVFGDVSDNSTQASSDHSSELAPGTYATTNSA